MPLLDRADLARLVEAYGGAIEGTEGKPMLRITMTPHAALWLMGMSGAAHIEAEVIAAGRRADDTPASLVAASLRDHGRT